MNEKQRDGMERAGETGEIIDRRAGERRAAAPVVAVVPEGWRDRLHEMREASYTLTQYPELAHVIFDSVDDALDELEREALASQAQAVANAPVPTANDISDLWINEDFAQIETDSTLNLTRKELKNAYVKARDDLSYWKRRALESEVAAQAAVGVASQQEQPTDEFARFVAWSERFTKESGGSVMAPRDAWMAAKLEASQQELVLALPDHEQRRIEKVSDEIVDGKRYVCVTISESQLSCNAALRAAPEVQHDASIAALTTGEIVSIARQAYDDGRLAWAGFTENERGHFTVPMLSQCHFDLARAIEAELARRFRAPGGNTNDKASPDLASIASQAQGDPIRALIAEHAELLEENEYTYFELAYTRRTAWMAWLCSNHREVDSDRKVLAKGQGGTPEEACADAIRALKTPTES